MCGRVQCSKMLIPNVMPSFLFGVQRYFQFICNLHYFNYIFQVPEAQFENCLSHHTTQLQAVTGWYVHSFNLFLHDLRLLLLRFAHEQSFSVDSGGGGPQSNLYYLPYVLHIGLYLLNV